MLTLNKRSRWQKKKVEPLAIATGFHKAVSEQKRVENTTVIHLHTSLRQMALPPLMT